MKTEAEIDAFVRCLDAHIALVDTALTILNINCPSTTP